MIDFDGRVLNKVMGAFSRPIVFTPLSSNPAGDSFTSRGVFHTVPVDVMTEVGVVFSDHKTTMHIRAAEFPIWPTAQDRVYIPANGSLPDLGLFCVQDVDHDAEGALLLTIRKYVPGVLNTNSVLQAQGALSVNGTVV